MQLDALIFGGGVAGLWLLDLLSRQGSHAVLLESQQLGQGQTISSQGIIHGGLKYTLQGLLTKSARHIAEMPEVWRDALLGARMPNLSRTRVRAGVCHLWQTTSLSSRLGMIGARVGLRVVPELIPPEDRPEALALVPGTVARLGEQVLSPESFLRDLAAQYSDRILKIDLDEGLTFELDSPGEVRRVILKSPEGNEQLTFSPRQVIFTAGAGNSGLRKRVGLDGTAMQRRPLHMIVARGNLPELNGHCVDGAKTRATITSDLDSDQRTVWQIGGQVSEDGVAMESRPLIEYTIREIQRILPGVSLQRSEWTSYRIDRAEGVTSDGARPQSVQVLCAGNVTTGWPTKLALAPVLAQQIATRVNVSPIRQPLNTTFFENWPRPEVARPPWETAKEWIAFSEFSEIRRAA